MSIKTKRVAAAGLMAVTMGMGLLGTGVASAAPNPDRVTYDQGCKLEAWYSDRSAQSVDVQVRSSCSDKLISVDSPVFFGDPTAKVPPIYTVSFDDVPVRDYWGTQTDPLPYIDGGGWF